MVAYAAVRPAYVEPVPVEEELAAGPAIVRVIENGVYIVLYLPHVSPDDLARGEERRICVRLVMPRAGAARLARAIDTAIISEGTNVPDRSADMLDELFAAAPQAH